MAQENNQQSTDQSGTDNQPTPNPSSGGSSFLAWLIFIAIIGGGGYAYLEGYLDKPLIWLSSQSNQRTTSPSTANTITLSTFDNSENTITLSTFDNSENTITLSTFDSSANTITLSAFDSTANPTVVQPVQPVVSDLMTQVYEPTPQPTSDTLHHLDGMLSQLEAMHSRIIRMENQISNLQSISEQQANQIDRQFGHVPTDIPTEQLQAIELSLIDLRLRITGDTHAAIRELNQLANRLGDDSDLINQINLNKSRLGNIPTRTHLFELFTQLDHSIRDARIEVEKEINALSNTQQADESSILDSLFTVRADDTQLQEELRLIGQVALTIEPTRLALVQGVENEYLERIGDIKTAADRLSSSFASVYTTQMAKALSMLTNFGFPQTYLILDTQTSTNTNN